MEDKYSLEGKLVSLFLRGSWEFTGRVEFSSKEKIVLKSDMGSLVVYKENLVAAMIIDETKKEEPIEAKNSPGYDEEVIRRNFRPQAQNADFYNEQYDRYGSIIPEDMLEGSSEEQFSTDFTISMFNLKNVGPEEGENGSGEKTSKHRGKD